MFVVRRIEVDYLRPAHLDDSLTVVTEPLAVGGASVLLRQDVRGPDGILRRADGAARLRPAGRRPTGTPAAAVADGPDGDVRGCTRLGTDRTAAVNGTGGNRWIGQLMRQSRDAGRRTSRCGACSSRPTSS